MEAVTRGGLLGSIPMLCSLLNSLFVTITAAVGPSSTAGRGIGEALFESEVPTGNSPCQATLQLPALPLHRTCSNGAALPPSGRPE